MGLHPARRLRCSLTPPDLDTEMIFKRNSLLATILLAGACGPQVQPEVRFVILGDSITGSLDDDTYPRFLVGEMGLDAGELATESAGGRTVAQGLERMNEIADLDPYPNATVFIYFLGGADIIDFVRAVDPGLTTAPSEPDYPFDLQLEALLDDVRNGIEGTLSLALAGGYQTFIASYHSLPADVAPCDLLDTDVLSQQEAERVNQYVGLLNGVIEDLASALPVTLVDIRSDNAALLADPSNFADCLHPSAKGAAILAERFAATLQM